MSWSFLPRLLEEIHNDSTFVGKIWLTFLIVFRIVLIAVEGEPIYYDEQNKFVCNTDQPGCENVCYSAFAPLSHVRFWVFQIILVATPSLMYLVYAVNKIAGAERVDSERGASKQAEDDQEKDPMISEVAEVDSNGGEAARGGSSGAPVKGKVRHDGRQRIKEDGLMRMYVLQVVARFFLEVAFLFGQYTLYGFSVSTTYLCSDAPCPHQVDCFVSRSSEKTTFLRIMYIVSVLCVVLNIWEILHLGIGTIYKIVCSRHGQLPDDELHGLTQGQGALSEAGLKGESYSNEFSWNAPLSPPGYNTIIVNTGRAPKILLAKQTQTEAAASVVVANSEE